MEKLSRRKRNMAKFVKTIRNNWKKSVFFSGAALYGANYAKHQYEDSVLRSLYCAEAKKYGELPLRTGEKARRITVFLNPAANGGRGKQLFDKTVAPLLYLAGCEVTVVKTEYEGQVKKYMEVIENTDAIIAAGGDGTLLEVVTGLLRRPDQESISKIPIGVVPIGKTNKLANILFEQDTEKSQVWWLSENAMAIVKNVTQHLDVMRIKGDEDKTVYAVSGIDWGYFRNVNLSRKNYWYLGPLKDYWAYIRATVGPWPHTVSAKLTYTDPCEGCSRCVPAPPPVQWKWWHFFIPPKVAVPDIDYSKISNENCGREHCMDVNSMEVACSCNVRDSDGKSQPMTILLGNKDTTKAEFIKEGINRSKHIKTDYGENISMNSFILSPVLNEDEESWFSIDSEDFEAMKIDVKLLKKKLNFFCPRPVNVYTH